MRYFLHTACSMAFILIFVATQRAEAIQFQSNLVMHYDASNVITVGSGVTNWINQGSAGAALDALSVATPPTLVSNALNGQAVIRFTTGPTGATVNTLRTGALGSDLAQPLTIINVGLVRNSFAGNLSDAPFYYDGRIGTKRAAQYHNFGPTAALYAGTTATGGATPLETFSTWSAIFNSGTSGTGTATSYLFRDGTLSLGPSNVNTQSIDGLTIGARYEISGPNNGTNRLNGDMAELLVYNRLLNAAEFKIISNHYSAKYQLPVATNLYNGDNNGVGGYDFNVFGIGNSGAITGFAAGTVTSGTEQRGLTINSTGSLDVNDFVLAGDRDLPNGFTGADAPEDVVRWERVWNIDQTGTSNFDLVFDFSDAGLSFPVGTGDFKLLYSSTETLDFSVVSETFSISGDQVIFSIQGAQFLDGYYTLGFSVAPEPSSVLLLGVGTLFVARRQRREKSNKVNTDS